MDESLREAVLHRLSALDEAAEQGDAGALLPLARTEIHRLTDCWRLLLTGHSHQAWPDCGFAAQQRAWLDAAARGWTEQLSAFAQHLERKP